MKKSSVLFLCIIIVALSLSAYAQENNSKTLSESEISSSKEAILLNEGDVSTADGYTPGNNWNDYSEVSLPDVDISSDMSAPAYEPSPNNLEDNPELELKLIEDYFTSYEKLWGTMEDVDHNEIKLEHIYVSYYFGSVNSCEVALMPRYYTFPEIAHTWVNAAGYSIILNTPDPLVVRCGSEFYELEDAYEQGILTKENIYEIGKLIEAHGWGNIS